MRVAVVATVVVLMLAGCAEEGQPDEAQPTTEVGGNETVEPGMFHVTLQAGNATAGANITLTLGIEAPEGLNASLVTWRLEAYNGTDNATADGTEGNATTNGTAANGTTAGTTNSTAANGTAGTSLANGTGLPAALNTTLPAGNHTLRLVATAPGYLPAEATLALEVLEAVPSDPCFGAPIQEPVPFSGLFLAAANGAGFYSGNPFDLLPCQTKIFVELTTSEAALDPMLRLKDQGGATVDQEDNEFLYHETLTYEPGGYLEPGQWQIDVRGYAAGPGNYKGTITFE